MVIGKVPAMFVSSTCYDLKQVRADLKEFIESFGMYPVISEYDSFPVDPNLKSVENCLQVVDQSADIFLLIIGGRYGSTNEQEKSVTNMEYLRARAKGIPIYIFIEKSILNILPVWNANPDGDFSNVVDSPKLFEFVQTLREADGVWTHPFEVAQQIIESLRKQLAYLFMDALDLRKQIQSTPIPMELADAKGMPLRLVIERPPYWEYRLFAHSLTHEIEKMKQRRWDLKYGIAFGTSIAFKEPLEIFDWVTRKTDEGRRIATVLANIVNVALLDAFAPSGVSGDAVKIVYASRRLASAYEASIEWSMETKRVSVPEEFQRLVEIVGTFLNGFIEDLETFSKRILRETEDVIANPPKKDEERVLSFKLDLRMTGEEEFHEELDRLGRSLLE